VISAPSNFETLLRQALREALGNPRRATHISLPNNVAAAQFDTVHFPQRPENYRVMPRNSNPGQAAAALPRLTQARRPLLLLGNGCRQALLREGQLANLMAIVERFAIPVMTTPNGKGIFPESHPLSLRNYGLAACEWPKYYMHLSPQLQRLDRQPVYDALLVMGSALGDLATRMHTPWDPLLIPHGPFMQVDLNPNMIARSFPVALGIIGDIAIVLDNLRTAAERLAVDEQAVQERAALIEEIKTTYAPFTEPAKRRADVTPILPQALMAIVNELLPAGSHIFVDCANCVGWSLHYMVVDPPTEMHQALAMGPMGFGVGSVVGGKLGAPERTCVAIVGDGAFLMHGAEVSTAAQYYIGAIWIVLRDNNLTMVSQGQNVSYPDPGVWDDSYQIGQPDLVRYAEGLGAVACGVERPEQVRVALARAIQAANQDKPRPQVIVVQHNPHEIPPYYPLPYPPPSPAASI
jgi:acetolactate synthase-1/2/3 large subunit